MTTRKSKLRRESDERRKKKKKKLKDDTTKRFLFKIACIVMCFLLFFLIMRNSGFEVEKIVVEGNDAVLAEDIISLSGIDKGDKIFKLDTTGSEKQICLHVMIEDASVRVNPFHTVTIAVTERDVAVGFKDGNSWYYLDDDKTCIIETDEEIESIPLLNDFESSGAVSIGISLEDEINDDIITIAGGLENRFEGYTLLIDCKSGEGSTNIIYINGIQVRLGALNRMDEKLDTLETYLAGMSVAKLESLDYIDLTVPDEPIFAELPVETDESEEEYEDNIEN